MAAPVVTIFGGSGFIGRYLVQRLAKQGWIIRVAVRDPVAALFLKPMGAVGQITPIAANIRDDASVAAAVAGADAVVNLVAVLYERRRQTFAALHVEGAARVARAAKAAQVKTLVHMSAIGAERESRSDYARSKAAGEAAVRAVFAEATIVRASIVFGPEDDFFNRFAGLARILPALPLIGGGHTRFQPVYVGDVAEALAKTVTDAATRGQTYELGGPQVYTFRELMALLLRQIGRRRLLLPLPFFVASLQAGIIEMLLRPLVFLVPALTPPPPLTRDQVRLLQHDNVASGAHPGLAELGIEPTAVEIILPGYLARFRRARGR